MFDLMPPMVPASSPLLMANFEPLIAAMLAPSTLTVVVPSESELDCATFGYGIGTGPPGVGVLHTSGTVAGDDHEPLCARGH